MSLLDEHIKDIELPPEMSLADITKFYKLDVTEMLQKWVLKLAARKQTFTMETEWNSPRERFVAHPSSMDNSCDYYIYLEMLGEETEKKVSPDTQMILDMGTAAHTMMQYYQTTRALQHRYEYQSEVGFSPKDNKNCAKLKFAGHADGLSIKWPTSCRTVWEYKSISRKGFERLTSPHRGYVKQVHLYMLALLAPAAIIVYICKDNSQVKAFKVRFDEAEWVPLLERLLSIRACILNGTEPEKKVGPACRRCGYKESCKPDLSSVRQIGQPPRNLG